MAFAICVIMGHYTTCYENEVLKYSWHGWISVEFFFILSGFLMAAYCARLPEYRHGLHAEDEPVYAATWKFMKRKIAAISPVYYLALFLTVVHQIWVTDLFSQNIRDIRNFFAGLTASILILPSQGLRETCAVAYSWYIGSMLWALLAIFPLLYILRKNFSLIIAPLLTIAFCCYAMQKHGNLWILREEWLGFCWPQLLRAGANISLGCISFEISTLLRKRFEGRLTKVGRSLFTGFSIILLCFPIFWIINGVAGKPQFCVIVMMALGIAISFSGLDNMYKLAEMKWSRTLFGFLGNLSLPIYLGQGIVSKIFPAELPAEEHGIYLFLVGCFIMAIILQYGGKCLTVSLKMMRKFLGRLCISEKYNL